MSEQHSSPIKTPKQLIIVVVLAFVVPITLIILIAQLVTGHNKGSSQESAEAVLHRIRPVGELRVAGEATNAATPNAPAAKPSGATPPATPTARVAAAKVSAAEKGKSIFETTCVACHGTGVAGAPKAGDKAAWAPRLQRGKQALYATALHGKNAMPPKGGNAGYSDDDVKAAVDYMVGLAK